MKLNSGRKKVWQGKKVENTRAGYFPVRKINLISIQAFSFTNPGRPTQSRNVRSDPCSLETIYRTCPCFNGAVHGFKIRYFNDESWKLSSVKHSTKFQKKQRYLPLTGRHLNGSRHNICIQWWCFFERKIVRRAHNHWWWHSGLPIMTCL